MEHLLIIMWKCRKSGNIHVSRYQQQIKHNERLFMPAKGTVVLVNFTQISYYALVLVIIPSPPYYRDFYPRYRGFLAVFIPLQVSGSNYDSLQAVMGAVVQLVEYRTRNREVAGSTHTGPLQATLSKLLTYCVLRPTQPPTLSGTGNE